MLRKRGVTPIEAVGTTFDPQIHQAVAYEEAPDRRDGEVTGTIHARLSARRQADTPRHGESSESVSKRDYYEVLGVPKNAGDQQIKSAYRKLALEHHPDQNPGNPAAEDRFKEAAEAYAILSDGEKRAKYDRFGHAGVSSQAGAGFDPSTFAGFEDIFGGIFGDFFGGGRARRSRARQRSALRPRNHVRGIGEGRRNGDRHSAPRNLRHVQRLGRRARHQPDDVSAVPGARAAALSAGILHRRAHVLALPGIRPHHLEAVRHVQRRGTHDQTAHAHGQDSRGHRRRPASAHQRRRRRRTAERAGRRSVRVHRSARSTRFSGARATTWRARFR